MNERTPGTPSDNAHEDSITMNTDKTDIAVITRIAGASSPSDAANNI